MRTAFDPAMLAGGDRRSIGRADEVAASVLDGSMEVDGLFEAMFDDDAIVRMRAADALEKVSAQRPEWLHPFRERWLARLPDVRQMEVRWHTAQMLPRLRLTPRQLHAVAVPWLVNALCDRSRIVQVCALQALADLAESNETLRRRVMLLAGKAEHCGGPALKVRSRRILEKWRARAA